MVKTTTIDASESRRRILDAARAEFAEKGFDGARVDGIARRAEVNKALIYYYFQSKDELLQELLRDFLAERRELRAKLPQDTDERDLPDRIARMDIDFLFERRDLLRIALMEDLKASKDGIPNPGTILKHWLDGLVEARDAYTRGGYGFRYTPRVVAAMYFYHLIPMTAFATMGETLAKALGIEVSALRDELLKLAQETNRQQFHSVFGNSVADPTPEVALPGLQPQPPSDLLMRVHSLFREGALYSASQAETLLSTVVPDPSEWFAKLVGYRYLALEPGGRFRWLVPPVTPPPKANAPQDHLRISPTERAALVAKHMPAGRLEHFPLKEKARLAVIEHISTLFRKDRTYSEREVDALLKTVVDDHAKARRYLIDYQFLHRKPDGSAYWTWDSRAPEKTPQ